MKRRTSSTRAQRTRLAPRHSRVGSRQRRRSARRTRILCGAAASHAGAGRRNGRGSTLLALVQEVQKRFENDADVVRKIRFLVNSGAVVLTGTFAGAKI
jgi:hypothetical protein